MTYKELSTEMIQALTDEILAIKEGGDGRDIPLYDGLSAGDAAGQHLYDFALEHELSVPDDAPGMLKVGNDTYEVTVVSTEGFEIVLAVPQDLGARIPSASLNVAPYFLLERLRDRITEASALRTKANQDMSLRLFNRLPNIRLSVGEEPQFGVGGQTVTPNEEQKKAVKTAISQAVTFIWGPPGTGKTTTVNHLVPFFALKHERVLVTSYTNTAVDQVLSAAKKGLTREAIEDGAIIRLGRPKDPNVNEDILLEEVVKRKSAALLQEQEFLKAQLEHLKTQEKEWDWWNTKFVERSTLSSSIRQYESSVACALQDRRRLESHLKSCRTSREELTAKLQEATQSGFLRRLIKGLNPDRIQADIDDVDRKIEGFNRELTATDDRLTRAEGSLAQARQNMTAVQSDMDRRHPIPSAGQVSEGLSHCRRGMENANSRLNEIAGTLKDMTRKVIEAAVVIGCTLSKLATTKEAYESRFANVIVDEISMTPQPHLWFCAGLAEKRIILLGDFRQLPPICTAETPEAQQRIARSIFYEAGILDEAGKVVTGNPRLTSLLRQYRMHPVIGELANTLVYSEDGNALVHCASEQTTTDGRLSDPVKGAPLVICDTSSIDPWCSRPANGYSRYNLYSAVVAVRLAEIAVASNPDIEIGIASPYATQARLIQRLLVTRQLSGNVKAATIHRFQGNERDLIIVDLVDGKPFKPGLPLTKSAAINLLNVALTRAKGKLIWIANQEFLAKRAVMGPLPVIFEYCRENGAYLDSTSILVGYGESEILEASKLLRLGRNIEVMDQLSIHSEGTFYPAVFKDMRNATEEVIIFSPFLEKRRASEVIPIIRYLRENRVSVSLFTRRYNPETVQGQLIQLFKDLSVNVIGASRLHEKLVIIDKRIFWMGSLNMLSQNRTTELMLRSHNPDLTRMLIEFTGVTGQLREAKAKTKRRSLLQQLQALLEPPACPQCGQEMVLRTSRYGLFWGCKDYPKDKTTASIPKQDSDRAMACLAIPCPDENCPGIMQIRRSKAGVFLGCTRYPDCKQTMNLR